MQINYAKEPEGKGAEAGDLTPVSEVLSLNAPLPRHDSDSERRETTTKHRMTRFVSLLLLAVLCLCALSPATSEADNNHIHREAAFYTPIDENTHEVSKYCTDPDCGMELSRYEEEHSGPSAYSAPKMCPRTASMKCFLPGSRCGTWRSPASVPCGWRSTAMRSSS